MSQGLRRYVSCHPDGGDVLHVVAYVQQDAGYPVQLTLVGDKGYCSLSEEQIRDLILVLMKRIQGEWTATGDESDDAIILPNGEKSHFSYGVLL